MRIIAHFFFLLSYLCSVKADIRQHPGFVYKSLNEEKNLGERKLTEDSFCQPFQKNVNPIRNDVNENSKV